MKFAVLGSINMDLLLKMHHVPAAGESHIIDSYSYLPGGKGANSAAALARLGADVVLFGAVGPDEHGKTMRSVLQKEGVDIDGVGTGTLPTGLATVLLEQSGQNRICIYPGANGEISDEYVEKTIAAQPDALIMQFEIPENTVINATAMAAERGIRVIIDAGPAQDFPIEKLKGVYVFSPNETECQALTGVLPTDSSSCRAASQIIKNRTGAQFVVIKMGDKGCYVSGEGVEKFFGAYRVKAVDTTAAGDSFTAALTKALVETGDIEYSVKFASAAGALTVQKMGALPSLPYKTEVENFLKSAGTPAE